MLNKFAFFSQTGFEERYRMSTVLKLNGLLIEGYIRRTLYKTKEISYPYDITRVILSHYANPSHFVKAGPLCTIQNYNDKSILTCQHWNCCRLCKQQIYGVLYVLVALPILIAIMWILSHYISVIDFGGFIIFLFYACISILNLGAKLKQWDLETTTNGCYGSVLMSSNSNAAIEHEHNLKVLKCTKHVQIFLGLIEDRNIGNKSYLVGMRKSIRKKVIRACAQYQCSSGDRFKIVYRPAKRSLHFKLNNKEWFNRRLPYFKSVRNYRLYVGIEFGDIHSFCSFKKLIEIEML